MKKNQKTTRFFIIVTSLLGLNLLILGKAFAQTQSATLSIQSGNLTLAVPTSITFPRTVLQPGNTAKITAVENPNDQLQTVEVIDPWSGNQFHVNVSLENLANAHGDIISYSDIGLISLHSNTNNDSVDVSNGRPTGTNNVESPVSYYFEETNANPLNFPDGNYTTFQHDPLDANPEDAGSVSLPITIMQRTVTTASSGIYSVGLALRANIADNNPAGNYQGQLTISLDP